MGHQGMYLVMPSIIGNAHVRTLYTPQEVNANIIVAESPGRDKAMAVSCSLK